MKPQSSGSTLSVSALLALMVVSSPIVALGQEEDPWQKDHPLVSRYPGSEPMGSPGTYRDFDEFTLVLGKVKGEESVEKSHHLEGRIYSVHYRNPEGRSVLEIYKNYEAALMKGGFKPLYSCRDAECGAAGIISREVHFFDPSYLRRFLAARLARGEGEVFVSLLVQAQDPTMTGSTQLHVIEVKSMEAGLVTVNAEALASGISATGHIAVYGIYFDTGKADIKPESEPALREIAKLLQQSPRLKLHVVGHTDSTGDLAMNMDLSKRRAQSVVQALTTKHGIAAARLHPEGVGPLAPVESNKSEEGRAKNRRVELVEQ